MRILMWVRNAHSEIGGIERLVAQLSEALRARGHQVGFIAELAGPHFPSREATDGVPIWRFGMVDAMQRNDLSEILQIISGIHSAVREFAPDVISFHPSGPETFVFLRVRRRLRVPVVTTIHVDFEKILIPGRRSALAETLHASDAVVAVSQFIAGQIGQGIPELGPVHIITNAVDNRVSDYSPPVRKDILMLGRIVSDKGFDVAIAAMPAILAGIPDARLKVGGDGFERAALMTQAKDLNVAGNIDFDGWIAPEDVAAAMKNAAIIMVPSRWNEPFGLVALEAAWAGRPVIATRRGGLMEIVVDGETGILVPHNDPVALSRAAISILKYPDTAQRMGKAALERANSVFSFEEFVDRYLALYQGLTN